MKRPHRLYVLHFVSIPIVLKIMHLGPDHREFRSLTEEHVKLSHYFLVVDIKNNVLP